MLHDQNKGHRIDVIDKAIADIDTDKRKTKGVLEATQQAPVLAA